MAKLALIYGRRLLPGEELGEVMEGAGVLMGEIVVGEGGRVGGKFEALPALVASHQVIEPHHVRTGLCELFPVFFADAARQFLFLPANLPAHGSLEFPAATRTDQLYLPGFFFFPVK